MAVPYRFRPAHRLHSAAEFERAYRHGQRVGDGLFAVSALATPRGHARLGMSVGVKSVGGAVRRNRVRRLVRETFRHLAPELPSVDLVVTSRGGARLATDDELRASVERLLQTAARRALAPRPRA